MRLPDDAIGPTDIQAYRDCPRRFAFGMRRHTSAGEHPEAQGPNTAYGSAIHEAIAYAEMHDATDEQAMQRAFDTYAKWLEPADLARLREDMATYRAREPVEVRTVAVELEFRMPLCERDGRQIHLRGRLDRVYQSLSDPGVFIHRDYKSSRWPKSQREVDEDVQMWTYNLAIHWLFPECEQLRQEYDQLAHGILTTSKSDDERALIRDWLIRQISAILADHELAPTRNQWCAWCPIMESCPVVGQLSDYALGELAALAPERRDGRRTEVDLDPAIFDVYVEQLEQVGDALRVLRRFDERVRGALREMPERRRRALGFELREQRRSGFSPAGLRAAHELLGDRFYELATLSKTAVERSHDPGAAAVLDMAEPRKGPPQVHRTTMS